MSTSLANTTGFMTKSVTYAAASIVKKKNVAVRWKHSCFKIKTQTNSRKDYRRRRRRRRLPVMEDELKSSSSSVSQYAGEVEGGDGSSCSRDRHSDIDSDDEWTLDDMGASDNTLPPVSPLEWQAIPLINQKPSSSPPLLSRPPSSPSFPFLSFPSVSYHL